jgi:hypothetical protein
MMPVPAISMSRIPRSAFFRDLIQNPPAGEHEIEDSQNQQINQVGPEEISDSDIRRIEQCGGDSGEHFGKGSRGSEQDGSNPDAPKPCLPCDRVGVVHQTGGNQKD